jgi:sialic acid synthase SpsE
MNDIARLNQLADEIKQAQQLALPDPPYKEPEVNHREDAPKAGQLAALAMAKLSEVTAADLEKAATALVDRALAIQKEANEFASIIRDQGKSLFERIEDASARADKASEIFRKAREELVK